MKKDVSMKKILFAATVVIVAGAIVGIAITNNANTENDISIAQQEPAAGESETMTQENPIQEMTVEEGVYELRIKDHIFTPDELRVPAGEKFKIVVYNDDPTPEEFESDDFRREKIIAGNSKATINVGPLEPGKYHFFGEFNLDKANGYLYAE